jgi:Uma2 family endonuclease
MLRAETGLPQSVSALAAQMQVAIPEPDSLPVVARNVAAELSDRSSGSRYPSFHVYCERITNSLREKFRTFSGTADLIVEVRVSHDRLEEVEQQLQLYVDAVTDVLDRNRGEWSQGYFYTGGYEVLLGAVKQGGKHFLQTAKVRFVLHISAD